MKIEMELIKSEKEKLKQHYEELLAEKENQYKTKIDAYSKDIDLMKTENLQTYNLTLHSDNEIKRTNEMYNEMKRTLDDLTYDKATEYISIAKKFENLNEKMLKKMEERKVIKEAFNEIITVAKEMQITFKNYQDFIEPESDCIRKICSELFEFYNPDNIDLFENDCKIVFLFLTQLKHSISDIFDNLNMNFLSNYQLNTIGKLVVCSYCNKYGQVNNVGKDSFAGKCKRKHVVCVPCYKTYNLSKLYQKHACFCCYS